MACITLIQWRRSLNNFGDTKELADKHAEEHAEFLNVPQIKMGPDTWTIVDPSPDGKSFTVKDSGKRQQFESGMVRDVTEGKTDYSLVLDGPMFRRWAEHLTKGAQKYSKRNWMKAAGDGEYERFKESALRHFLQWYWGETDEDHASAVFFNINGAEYVKSR
jgi:hypothetical protein